MKTLGAIVLFASTTSLFAGLGCGMFTPTVTKHTAFDASRVPPGDSFSCFERVTGKDADAVCFRTAEECTVEHDKAKAREDVTSVGTCEKQPSAACFVVHREKGGGLITDPSQLGDKSACFRTVADCEAVQKTWAGESKYGISEVTACGAITQGAPNAKAAEPAEEAWKSVTLDARPAPAASKDAKLAAVSRTPAGETKPFTEDEAKAAMADLKVHAMTWDEAAKRVVAKLGKPAYSITPSRTPLSDEDWYWISPVPSAKKCVTTVITRRGEKLDGFGPVGEYYNKGEAAHATEEVQQGKKGHLHLCEGAVTAKSK